MLESNAYGILCHLVSQQSSDHCIYIYTASAICTKIIRNYICCFYQSVHHNFATNKCIGHHDYKFSISFTGNNILLRSPHDNGATFWWGHARKPLAKYAPMVSQKGVMAIIFGQPQYSWYSTFNAFNIVIECDVFWSIECLVFVCQIAWFSTQYPLKSI